MASADLRRELTALLGADRVMAVPQGQWTTVDGRRPSLAVLPETIDEVAATLRFAGAHGLAVAPWGSGLHMELGNAPSRLDLALHLTRLNAVSDYSPEDLVVTAQAGITLEALNARLAAHGQFLPLDTPHAGGATAGGALSANLSGPHRLRYGTGRDLVIGLTCVLADGAIVHSGGRVVKNVAGYDLNKLYIGALGTLGVIVEVSFKLYPIPAAHASVTGHFADCESAQAAALALVNSPYGPTAVEIAGPTAALRLFPAPTKAEPAWLLAALLGGMPAAVDRQRREVARLMRESGAGAVADADHGEGERLFGAIRDYGRRPDATAALILRCTVLPSEIAAALARIQAAVDCSTAEVLASPGAGLLRLFWTAVPPSPLDIITGVRGTIEAIGGTVTVERCPPALKATIDVWGIAGSDLGLMRSMKDAYDPHHTLNPGRYVDHL